jgi:hypothetical protein
MNGVIVLEPSATGRHQVHESSSRDRTSKRCGVTCRRRSTPSTRPAVRAAAGVPVLLLARRARAGEHGSTMRWLWIVMAGSLGCKSGGGGDRRDDPRVDLARVRIQQLVHEGYLLWTTRHADTPCPTSLDEIAAMTSSRGTRDPWDTPLQMYCGADLPEPARAHGFAVSSAGADRTHGTADDVRSWDGRD